MGLEALFPVEPVLCGSLAWSDSLVSVATLDTVFVLDVDTINEAAPTYATLPKENTPIIEDSEDPVGGSTDNHSAPRVTSFAVSPPLLHGKVYKHLLALSSQQNFFLCMEVSAGPWLLVGDLKKTLQETLATSDETKGGGVSILCSKWHPKCRYGQLLVSGSKEGAIFFVHCDLLVNSAISLSFVLPDVHDWVTVVDVIPSTDSDETIERFFVVSGGGDGSVILHAMEMETKASEGNRMGLRCINKVVLVEPDDIVVPVVRFGKYPHVVAYTKGCMLSVYESGRPVRSQKVSERYVTDIQWSHDGTSLLVSSLDERDVLILNSTSLEVIQSVSTTQAAHWGVYGARYSPLGLFVAFVTKTPKGQEGKMFTKTYSKSHVQIRRIREFAGPEDVVQYLLSPEVEWSNREHHWELLHLLMELFTEEQLVALTQSIVDGWGNQSTAMESSSTDKWMCLLQLANSLSISLQSRKVSISADLQRQLENSVYLRYASRSLANFRSLTEEGKHTVLQTPEERQSLLRLCVWLAFNGTTSDTERTAVHQLAILFHPGASAFTKDMGDEECPVCFEPVALESCSVGECTNHHQFARCSKTLQLLSVVGNGYCSGCRRKVSAKLNLVALPGHSGAHFSSSSSSSSSWMPQDAVCSFCACLLREFAPF